MDFNGFTLSTEQETGCSLLVSNPLLPGELVIYQYQLEMLANNPGTSILLPEIRKKDDEVKIYYTVSSCVPLQEYLKNRRLTKQEFLELLMKIAAALLQGRELLLNERNFLLREDLVQIDLKTAAPYLVYLPVEMNDALCGSLKEFILHLITKTAFLEIKPGDHYLQRIIEYCKAGDFCSDGLKKLLNEIKFKTPPAAHLLPGPEESLPEEMKKDAASNPWGLFTEEADRPEPDENSWQAVLTAVGSMEVKTIGSAVFSQAALVVFCLAMESILKDQGIAPGIRYAFIGIFALVVDLILFRYLFSGSRKSKEAEQESPSDEGRENSREEVIESAAAVRNDETMLLSIPGTKGILIRDGSDGIEKYELGQERSLIGRKTDICDVLLEEKSVGRIHAEICCREGKYYLLDKNSKNGTSVNDERLLPGEERELKDNDRVLFSGIGYHFHIVSNGSQVSM